MDGRGNTRIDDLVNCTKARALRHQLREIWLLPKEDIFANSGPNGFYTFLIRWMQVRGVKKIEGLAPAE
jgi:hypothetical protein